GADGTEGGGAPGVEGGGAQTARSTATTLPRISAWSPRIGAKAGLCGISQTWSSRCTKVFTVASPSIIAATISPFYAVLWERTTTQSPSQMAASIIESQTTCSRKSSPSPTSRWGRVKTSSTCSSAVIGTPAAILPTRGTLTEFGTICGSGAEGGGAGASSASGITTSIARGRLGSRRRNPLRSSDCS